MNDVAAMPLRVLVVDDEPLARARLISLLADCRDPAALVVGEASGAVATMHQLQHERIDLVLLDVRMPGMSGMALADQIRQLPDAPAIIFVTAYAEHALQAFELDAVDYLTKPVRLERLQAALQKAKRTIVAHKGVQADVPGEVLIIQERGNTVRVPLAEVVYVKAELKYLTVRTAEHSYIMDGALSDVEQKYPKQFLRVHRNALVTRRAIRAVLRHVDPVDGDGWAVRLDGVSELVAISRRQLSAVRQAAMV